jgi:hypothetical protein
MSYSLSAVFVGWPIRIEVGRPLPWSASRPVITVLFGPLTAGFCQVPFDVIAGVMVLSEVAERLMMVWALNVCSGVRQAPPAE